MRSINERVTPLGPELRLSDRSPDGLSSGVSPGAERLMLRRRASAELILQRAPELDASDRSLLEAIYASGQSAAAVARLLGQPQRTVSARVRRLVRRVCTPEFGLVLLLQERWPKTRREVARACFVRGLSIREASQSLGITFHAARKHHAAIRAMAEAAA